MEKVTVRELHDKLLDSIAEGKGKWIMKIKNKDNKEVEDFQLWSCHPDD